jgi:hypothetical protein
LPNDQPLRPMNTVWSHGISTQFISSKYLQ